MLIYLSYHSKNSWLVRKSLTWLKELGGCHGHQCILLVDSTVRGDEEYKLAQQVFDKVGAEKVQVATTEWPACANAMFQQAAWHAVTKFAKTNTPWFFWEPDCIPIKAGAFDQIEQEYNRCGKPFLITSGGTPPHHNLCGNAVYPNNVTYFCPEAMTTVTEPWDAFIRDLKSHTAFTDLIYHDYGNEPGKFEGKPLTYQSRSALQKIMDSRAVMVHRCKDGSCIDVLSSNIQEKSFGHSGDLGDIVFALGVVKGMGGGMLYLKADSNCREPMTEKRFNAIVPLLKSQSYIKDVRWWKDEIVCFDFSEFRKEHKPNCSLLESQRKYINGPDIDPRFPWLMIEGNNNGNIVINRTDRYNNPTFPWKRLVELYGKSMVFLGLPEEHARFCSDFGQVAYEPTEDLLQASKWISGSHCFIGNQSSLYAIAEGIKHRRICEVSPHAWSQNVFLDGGQVQYVLSGNVDESWLQTVKNIGTSNGKHSQGVAVVAKLPHKQKVVGSIPTPAKRRGRPPKVKRDQKPKLPLEEAVMADKNSGLGWRDLLSKHKISAVQLKKILG